MIVSSTKSDETGVDSRLEAKTSPLLREVRATTGGHAVQHHGHQAATRVWSLTANSFSYAYKFIYVYVVMLLSPDMKPEEKKG